MRNDFTDDRPLVPEAVTETEVAAMVGGLLRHTNLLRDAMRVGLDYKHFAQSLAELPFYYLFAAMQDLYKHYGALTPSIVTNRLLSWRDSNQLALSPGAVTEMIEFVERSFTPTVTEPSAVRAERTYLEDIVRRFIRERMIKSEVQAALNTRSGAPDDLEAQLSQWTKKAQSVEFIGRQFEHAAHMPEIGAHIELPPPAIPTTLPFIDDYIAGFRAGDIIGVLGPFGGGKTTILAVTAVRMAERYFADDPDKLAVFIGYEDPASKMNPTFWSAAAQIDRSLFASPGGEFWSQLSTAETLKDYDRELPQNRNGEILVGERERWLQARPFFNNNFTYLDFSQNEATGNRGSGGVEEIIAALEQLSESTGKKIGFVAIDYAGIAVERQLGLSVRGQFLEQISRPIKNIVDQLRTRVAVPQGAVVMLAHQLAPGQIDKVPAYRYVSHFDSAGSKSFAENLHACLCVGKRDESCHVSTIYWSKLRYLRSDNLKGLIQFHPKVAEIRLVNDEYTVSEAAKRIIQRGDIAPVTPEEAATLARPRAATRRIMPVDTFAEDMMS
jgi:hypothetical protein